MSNLISLCVIFPFDDNIVSKFCIDKQDLLFV